jgi:starvation-inducible DNA-binding protein
VAIAAVERFNLIEPACKPILEPDPTRAPRDAQRADPIQPSHRSKSRMAKKSKSPPSAPINIGISAKDRAAIAAGLSRLLADTYTLYLTTHNFHWNVTGPMFNTLHAMFMAQYTELWNAVDPVAERIRSLGHPAPGSYAQFGKLASIKDAPAVTPKALAMVQILVEGHEAVARTGDVPIVVERGQMTAPIA